MTMTVDLHLEVFTSDWRVEEQGYQDPAIRDLAEAIDHTEAALDTLRGYSMEDVLDGEAEPVDDLPDHLGPRGVDTYRAALQAQCMLYAAVEYRLATLALDLGEDPEEVLHHV